MSISTWWDKINTANRILLPPSCFHSAALCNLPPPFVPLPSTEGVAATISLHQCRPSPLGFLKLTVCCVFHMCLLLAKGVRTPCWRYAFGSSVCFLERTEAYRSRMRPLGSFGCTCLSNVWENEGSVQTRRGIKCKMDSDRVIPPVIGLMWATVLGILEGTNFIPNATTVSLECNHITCPSYDK